MHGNSITISYEIHVTLLSKYAYILLDNCVYCFSFCLTLARKMGNSAGKENDINNLMHVTIVKDADLPKAEVSQNKASGEKVTHMCIV